MLEVLRCIRAVRQQRLAADFLNLLLICVECVDDAMHEAQGLPAKGTHQSNG
jgi:hypothetical protein